MVRIYIPRKDVDMTGGRDKAKVTHDDLAILIKKSYRTKDELIKGYNLNEKPSPDSIFATKYFNDVIMSIADEERGHHKSFPQETLVGLSSLHYYWAAIDHLKEHDHPARFDTIINNQAKSGLDKVAGIKPKMAFYTAGRPDYLTMNQNPMNHAMSYVFRGKDLGVPEEKSVLVRTGNKYYGFEPVVRAIDEIETYDNVRTWFRTRSLPDKTVSGITAKLKPELSI